MQTQSNDGLRIAEEQGAELILKLDKLMDVLEKSTVRSTAGLYKTMGLECQSAQKGLRVFWVKSRKQISQLVTDLNAMVSNLPGDNALDSAEFNYQNTVSKLKV